MIDIIDLIEINEWNRVKILWIQNVLKIDPDQSGNYNLEGDQFEMCDRFLISEQKYNSHIICSCCKSEQHFASDDIFLRKIGQEILITIKNQACSKCNQVNQVNIDSFMFPPYLIVRNADQAEITLNDLENSFEINDIVYELILFTFFDSSKKHYYGVVKINNNWILIDDLNPAKCKIFNQNELKKVFSCFYLKIN